MMEVVKNIRDVIKSLEEIVQEIRVRVKQTTEELSRKFQKEAFAFVTNFMKRS